MNSVISILTFPIPVFFGMVLLYGTIFASKDLEWSDHLIAIGSGIYVGYLLTASLIYFLLTAGINPFPSNLAVALIALTAISGFGCRRKNRKTRPQMPEKNITTQRVDGSRIATNGIIFVLIASWLGTIVLFNLHQVWHNPAIAWDTLWMWSSEANDQLSRALGNEPSLTVSSSHPATVVLISLWHAYWSKGTFALYAPWGLAYIGILLTSLGLVHKLTKNAIASLGFTAVLASAPMIESHVALGGYADIWLFYGALLAISVAMLGNVTTNFTYLSFGALILISLAFLKNSGFASAIVIVLGIIFAGLAGRQRWITLGLFSAVFSIISLYVIMFGIDLNLSFLSFSYDPNVGRIAIGSRSESFFTAISNTNTHEIFHNLAYAWLWSSSYSFIFGVSLITLPFSLVIAISQGNQKGAIFPSCALWFFIFFFFAQYYSNYFLVHSRPSLDTGLTRFSHVIFWLCTISLTIISQRKSHSRRFVELFSNTR